ncbi:MAG: hypothetical protein ACPLRW_07505 [Moorellales bacterium]
MRSERGLAEFVLLLYFVFFLTMMAFLLGVCLSLWRDAQAKHQWIYESLAFAAFAANQTGGVEEVELNQGFARRVFEAVLADAVPGAQVLEFRAVRPGDAVPGGTAAEPGYLAVVRVPLAEVRVPLLGPQRVEVPMRLFAVVQSREIGI